MNSQLPLLLCDLFQIRVPAGPPDWQNVWLLPAPLEPGSLGEQGSGFVAGSGLLPIKADTVGIRQV